MDFALWDEAIGIVRQVEAHRAPIADRLLLLEDKEKIRDVISIYCLANDSRHVNAQAGQVLADVFTDDVVFIMKGRNDLEIRGRRALSELFSRPFSRNSDGYLRQQSWHIAGVKIIRVADDNENAAAVCIYNFAQQGTDEDGRLMRGENEGNYLMYFRKSEGNWKISRIIIASELENARVAYV